MSLRATFVVALVLAVGGLAAGCGGDDGSATEAAPATVGSGLEIPADDLVGEVPLVAVTGEGVATGEPDLLTIGLGVETTAETASDALADNNRRANDVLAVLSDLGVDSADIQTADLSISPQFNDDAEITGYRVNNTVSARIRDLDRAGEFVDAVAFVAGDAVRVRGLSFSIDDPTALLEQARAMAVERAMGQAEQLASAAGVELGPVRTIDETNHVLPRPFEEFAADASAEGGFESTPISVGSQDVTVAVTMVYELDA